MKTTKNGNVGEIVVRGARTNNLKEISVSIPQEQLTVITGVSGSGKSSLAFDTIYAEGQRRYVESLSAYARQFLERMEKPDVDEITGICPAIAIRQKNSLRNPRSTVGTTTELNDYLRLLFSRVGRTICFECEREVLRDSAEVVALQLAALPVGTRLIIGFTLPVVESLQDEKYVDETVVEDHGKLSESGADQASPIEAMLDALRRKGFRRLVSADSTVSIDDVDLQSLTDTRNLQVVVDRVQVKPQVLGRLTESIETAYQEGGGTAFAIEVDKKLTHEFSELFECRECGISYELPQPRLFSFNSPFGACATCHGFGNIIELDLDLVIPDPSKSIQQNAIEPWSKPHYRPRLADLKRVAKDHNIRVNIPWNELSARERDFVVEGDGDKYKGVKGFFRWLESKKYKVHVRVFLSRYRGYSQCPDCNGSRLRREARAVCVGDLTIDVLSAFTVEKANQFFDSLVLTEKETAVAERILKEIKRRLLFLTDVGLEYLTLNRLSSTLSGGEAQRINLATSLGSSLVGTLYVLDEPSIGLHPRDNERLLNILRQLRDQGNTVLVVEHDAEMIRSADFLVDLGLGAGTRGGKIIYAGPSDGIKAEQTSLTAKYLRGELLIPVPAKRRKRLPQAQAVRVFGAAEHNLKNIDVEIPINMMTCVTGVSGSGKSTLVHDVLYAAIKKEKGEWDKRVGMHRSIEGAQLFSKVMLIDQSPIGRTPRSNPVTYLKAFDAVRELFASTKDAKARALTPSHFSFNVPGGRCETCEGEGEIRVEMQFLADVSVPCEDCDGKRFKSDILEVSYRGRNIDDVLDMTVREALAFFNSAPKVLRRLEVLEEVGLGYLRLGQAATTLSGGEAQRIKIASHLVSRSGDRILYILDEPTTGLHFDDIAKLITSFKRLLQAGHTLVIIEHNLDIIKIADWIIDLGPEGGEEGGHLVACGAPEKIVEEDGSYTGRYLAGVLQAARAFDYVED
tara:strand:+ start:350 stop:3247 length:2898 start_codon:yes stop_codon:yes gene_type:complete